MNTKKILLTGGRAPATLHLARLFKEAGFTVFVAESIDFHLCKYSNSVNKSYLIPSPVSDLKGFETSLKEIIYKEGIDILIPTCEETFHISRIKDSLTNCKVFTSNIEVMRMLHSKYEFNKSLAGFEKFVSIPSTTLIREASDLIEFRNKEKDIKKELVFKPVFSRFGSDVFFSNLDDLNPSILEGQEWVIQEKIEGYQSCSYSVCQDGQVLAFSNYKTGIAIGLGATVLFEPVKNEKILNFVKKYVQDIKFTGQISFDFIVDNKGDIFPIECNPRTTSGVCLFSGDSSISLAFTENLEKTLLGEERRMLSIPTLYAILRSGRIKELSRWSQYKDVIHSGKDMKPTLFQLYTFLRFFEISLREGISSTEATTKDIEWDGIL